MTQTQEKVQRTVAALVKSLAEAEDGWKAELEIADFKSKFPTWVNRIPAEDKAHLKPGDVANIILERGNLKKDKKGEWPTDYFWNWMGIAAPGSAPMAPTLSDTPAPTRWTEAYSQSREHSEIQRASIERQKALDLAVQFRLGIVQQQKEPTDAEHVIATAERFLKFLSPQKSPSEAGAQSQGPAVGPEAPDTQGAAPAGAPKTWPELWREVKTWNLVNPPTAATVARLSFDQAWDKIKGLKPVAKEPK